MPWLCICAPARRGAPLPLVVNLCPCPWLLLWGVAPAASVFRPLGNAEFQLLSASLCAPYSRCRAVNDCRPVRFSSEAVQGVFACPKVLNPSPVFSAPPTVRILGSPWGGPQSADSPQKPRITPSFG